MDYVQSPHARYVLKINQLFKYCLPLILLCYSTRDAKAGLGLKCIQLCISFKSYFLETLVGLMVNRLAYFLKMYALILMRGNRCKSRGLATISMRNIWLTPVDATISYNLV